MFRFYYRDPVFGIRRSGGNLLYPLCAFFAIGYRLGIIFIPCVLFFAIEYKVGYNASVLTSRALQGKLRKEQKFGFFYFLFRNNNFLLGGQKIAVVFQSQPDCVFQRHFVVNQTGKPQPVFALRRRRQGQAQRQTQPKKFFHTPPFLLFLISSSTRSIMLLNSSCKSVSWSPLRRCTRWEKSPLAMALQVCSKRYTGPAILCDTMAEIKMTKMT